MPLGFQDALQALRAADEAGNTEDARKLAELANRLRGQREVTPDRGSFLARGISQTIGAPVDIAAGALSLIPGVDIKEPIGGRKFIEQAIKEPPIDIMTSPLREAINLIPGIDIPTTIPTGIKFPEEGARPKTPAEFIGAGVGEVAGLVLPTGVVTKLLTRGTGLVSKITKTIWDTMVRHPYVTMASELTAGGGAGGGRFIGEEVAPELKPFAEIGGGIAGGIAPTVIPSRLIYRLGKKIATKAALPLTEAGARFRAGKFLKKQVVSPEEAAKRAVEPTLGDLPPVVATNENRLMALYRRFRDADPVTDSEAIESMSKSINKLEQELRSMGYSVRPEVLRNITQKRIAALELRIDNRVLKAVDNAHDKLNALPIAQRKAQESVVVRNELNKAMQEEVISVRGKWADVPKGLEVEFSGSRKAYKDIFDDLATAQRGDIPTELRTSFLTKKKVKTTTVKEMQGLRSKLREVSRRARANNEWNKARIADDVSDAILDDLGLTTADESLKTAIAATRQFKVRFEQGVVGRMLGFARSGAPTISPELALDISIGRLGARGAIDISKIAITPEATAATKRYLARSFTDYATDKAGALNVTKAQRWVKNNEAVLDQFPDLRTQLSDATGAQRVAENTRTLMDARKLRLQDPRISTSAQFLKTDIGNEVATIFKSSNPTRMTSQLVRQARKDPTGEALEGLKGGFVDHILEKSSLGPFNELGEQTLSGRALLGFVNKNRGALRQVLEPEQITRMEKIGQELAKLESAEKLKGAAPEIDLKDITSNVLRLVSRIGGAQIGRIVAGKTGGGTVQTPGIISDKFKNFATYLTKDRAFQLIHDAIVSKDGTLLRALLLPIDKPQVGLNNWRVVNQRMNVWLLGTGSRVLNDISEEIRGDQTTPEPELGAL